MEGERERERGGGFLQNLGFDIQNPVIHLYIFGSRRIGTRLACLLACLPFETDDNGLDHFHKTETMSTTNQCIVDRYVNHSPSPHHRPVRVEKALKEK